MLHIQKFMMKEPNERANKRHAKAKIQQYLLFVPKVNN